MSSQRIFKAVPPFLSRSYLLLLHLLFAHLSGILFEYLQHLNYTEFTLFSSTPLPFYQPLVSSRFSRKHSTLSSPQHYIFFSSLAMQLSISAPYNSIYVNMLLKIVLFTFKSTNCSLNHKYNGLTVLPYLCILSSF